MAGEGGQARVKLLCGQCGAVLATIVDDGDATLYRWRHGTSTNAAVVFCPAHGFATDLTADSLVAALARARATGKILQHKARVSRNPIPGRTNYAEQARARLTRR